METKTDISQNTCDWLQLAQGDRVHLAITSIIGVTKQVMFFCSQSHICGLQLLFSGHTEAISPVKCKMPPVRRRVLSCMEGERSSSSLVPPLLLSCLSLGPPSPHCLCTLALRGSSSLPILLYFLTSVSDKPCY